MAQAVLLPKLGQTVEEAAIVKWHAKEGDAVKKGEVLFEIETDKAVLEAESFLDGTLLKILVGENEIVPVQSVVAYVGKPGEKVPEDRGQKSEVRSQKSEAGSQRPQPAPELKPEPEPPAAGPEPVPARPAVPAVPAPAPASVVAPPPPAPRALEPETRLFISPRAKSLAKAKVIDPARITGSGPNGRIVVKDVKAYLEASNYDQVRITPAAKRLAAQQSIDILTVRGSGMSGRITVEDIERRLAARPRPLSRMRRTIARRLTQSFTTTPHFYVTVSADMTDLLAFRQELKDSGKRFTVTDFILEAVILTLQEMPVVNSVYEGDTIRWHESVDLGMAVGLDDGLVVPAIRSAQELTMEELHDIAGDLTSRARAGKLLPDEIIGSTFTVSNMGMFDVDGFHAIINPGESAILAVASTRERVAVVAGQMKIRSVMGMTLSVDHRIVDGTVAATFVNAVKSRLEDMELWKTLAL